MLKNSVKERTKALFKAAGLPTNKKAKQFIGREFHFLEKVDNDAYCHGWCVCIYSIYGTIRDMEIDVESEKITVFVSETISHGRDLYCIVFKDHCWMAAIGRGEKMKFIRGELLVLPRRHILSLLLEKIF